VERNHERSPKDKALRALIFSLFPHPKRLRLLRGPLRALQATGLDRAMRRTGLLERLSPQLAAMESLAPRLGRPEPLPPYIHASGERRAVVGLLTGCVQGAFFPGVNSATARVLAAEGCDVVVPRSQGCCGALSAHNGREPVAQRYARGLVVAFEDSGVDYVVVNAAGCGSTMKEYADLLADDPAYAARARAFAEKVRDVSEILDELGTVAPRHPLDMTIAYHDACHLAHAQGVRAQPRALLTGIPGLELREIAEGELCCGSAGIYNIIRPDMANDLGDRKALHAMETSATEVITANPGCLMQVTSAIERLTAAQGGQPMGMAHTIEVLDASIRGLPATTFTTA
jgi:glycolate oxidase iron-sulfur subunit